MPHIVIGVCPVCGHPLKVKEHAPRPNMHITCHCGWHGEIHPDEPLLHHAEELRAQGAGHRPPKTPWQRFLKRWRSWWNRRR